MGVLERFLSTAGYTGYAPVAPGTFGAGVGLGLTAMTRAVGGPAAELGVAIAVTVVGGWAAHVTERELGQEDPSIVVIDEVAGMLLTMLWVPLTWLNIIVGFLAFRVLDIVKPFPARRAERLVGGMGIMADDLIAGVYAAAVVRAIEWIGWSIRGG